MMTGDVERIREALHFIPACDRDTWLRMGMAVKSELGDTGFDLWEEWSQQDESFDPKAARAAWKSIRANGKVTAGTLFHEAKAGGWRDDGAHQKPTPEELSKRRRIAVERAAKEEVDLARERADAARKAAAIWKAATTARADHPYLSRKRVSPVATLREIDASAAAAILGYAPKSDGDALAGRLLVAPVKVDDALSTLELIDEAGHKSALYGGAKAGGYWAAQPLPEGDGASLTLLIGEGVATVLSAKEASGHPSIAALSAGNLPAVAKHFRQRYPAAELVLLADLVKATGAPDPHAIEAARAVGELLAIPDFGDNRPEGATDFNDLAQACGLEAVARAVRDAKPPVVPEVRASTANAPRGDGLTVPIITAEGTPRPQATVLIDIGRTHTLFHDLGGDAYARLGNGAVCAIGSSEYREVLGGDFYKLSGKGANRNALADAVTTLAAIAKHEGDAAHVFLRVGEFDGGIVIDTGRQDRACHVVRADGWSIVETPPIHFRRSGKPLSLPEPAKPDFGLLWRYVNVRPADRVLIAAFLLVALRPRGPYPPLVLIGEQGSGKSRTTRALKGVTDPSASPLRAPPQDVRDLLVAALSSWVLALDNMSGADPQLSDALCRLSTGGALSGRTLYTNSEETLIEVQRPVILNGIDDLATRPDLADRCIVLELPQLKRVAAEEDLDDGFRRDAGAIFAALLDGLRLALRDARALDIGNLPRMGGFAKWAAAGVPALGFTAEEFLAAYRANQAAAIETGLDSSAVGQAVRAFIAARREWTGPASALLRELAVHADTTSRSWPRSPKGLVNALRRLAPSLRHTGIVWSPARTAKGNLTTLACKEPGQAPQAPQAGALSEAMELMEDNRPPCTAGVADLRGDEAGPVEVEV